MKVAHIVLQVEVLPPHPRERRSIETILREAVYDALRWKDGVGQVLVYEIQVEEVPDVTTARTTGDQLGDSVRNSGFRRLLEAVRRGGGSRG